MVTKGHTYLKAQKAQKVFLKEFLNKFEDIGK